MLRNPNLVSFVTNVGHEELSGIMRNSRYLILLSKSEGLPKVLVESAACGVIPVLSNISAHREFLGEELSEQLCLERDSKKLASKVQELDLKWDVVSQGIMDRGSDFKWTSIAENIRKVYSEL
jgi:glycosyltransferase involved in cell wall biosynthesis